MSFISHIHNVIYYCDAKLDFQNSLSHDPSEIIQIWRCTAQETFLIIINVENS